MAESYRYIAWVLRVSLDGKAIPLLNNGGDECDELWFNGPEYASEVMFIALDACPVKKIGRVTFTLTPQLKTRQEIEEVVDQYVKIGTFATVKEADTPNIGEPLCKIPTLPQDNVLSRTL